jgi:hypothetical protein
MHGRTGYSLHTVVLVYAGAISSTSCYYYTGILRTSFVVVVLVKASVAKEV